MKSCLANAQEHMLPKQVFLRKLVVGFKFLDCNKHEAVGIRSQNWPQANLFILHPVTFSTVYLTI